jgi:hypothetical protein
MNYKTAEIMIADLSATDLDLRTLPLVELAETHRQWDVAMAEALERALDFEEQRRQDACARHDHSVIDAEVW